MRSELPATRSALRELARFLGTVRFTTALLVVGILAMVSGTWIETNAGRPAAWSSVYGTQWFDGFLLLLCVNLLAAVVNRWPLRRDQWPFALTHLAIVTLLAGAWGSRSFGYEGRMLIYEGADTSRITVEASEIRTRWLPDGEAPSVSHVVPIERLDAATGRSVVDEADGRPGVRVVEAVESGVATRQLVDGGPGDRPGVELTLVRQGFESRVWLLADDPEHGSRRVGPVEVVLSSAAVDPAARSAAAVVRLEPTPGAPAVEIALPEALNQTFPLGSGARARVLAFASRGRVTAEGLAEAADGPLNPAAVVAVERGGHTELHTVFALFPDFRAIRGREAGQPLVGSVRLDAGGLLEPPRLQIVATPEGAVAMTASNGVRHSASILLIVGHEVMNEALGLSVRLEALRPAARVDTVVAAAGPGAEGRPYLRLEAYQGEVRHALWVGRGGYANWHFEDGGRLFLAFGSGTRAVPFSVRLDDFELLHHPGSSRPSEFRSTVRLRTPEGADRRAQISMNRPLDIAGHRLFQTSYRLGDGETPDATILTVSRDPGAPIVYASFVGLVAGIGGGLMGRRKRARGRAAKRTRGEPRRFEDGVGGIPVRAGMGLLAAVALGLALATAPSARAEAPLPVEDTAAWAIQADGRVKPLRTFADETTLAVTGRERVGELGSLEFCWGFLLDPAAYGGRPLVRVDGPELKESAGLDPKARRYAYDALVANAELRTSIERAARREQLGERLDAVDRQALDVYARLERVRGLVSGEALRVVPILGLDGSWTSPPELQNATDESERALLADFGRLVASYRARDRLAFGLEVAGLTKTLRALNPSDYPDEASLGRELAYERLNPFGRAWQLYLVAAFVLLFIGPRPSRLAYGAALAATAAGFACHTLGLGLRWAIAGHAPVSNMYESLVFMGWGGVAVGLAQEIATRRRWFAMASALVGFVCLMFAEALPVDASINPLVPVLAHTSWLGIHVMTIMLSYSAFALAMVLGHVLLVLAVRAPVSARAESLSGLVDRMFQIGLLFLAAGIAFGAVWANESWGRYWGWDPKETWSLITFLVYVGILHARLAGWLGPFGVAASAILGFLAVVMTYYGVNFALASGLHSYGFSSGGMLPLGLLALVELAFVAGLGWIHHRRSRRAPPTIEAAARQA
ncbi:MAG: cytochrome c biogenesis protein CcsA [Deltaproteobacteria bacterium]|nr:cytochrome c biogenesis protein CcsA [Deltaproteobacteria bacterium]MBW2444708.1 cytochrome c biogenesis protein CcsA [Deltaproteobacteria bacterium]